MRIRHIKKLGIQKIYIEGIYPIIMKIQIVCPKCGQKFDRPKMDIKNSGFGWSPPGLGVIKCPHCGNKARRTEYPVADEDEGKA